LPSQRNDGASNVRKRCGVFRARVGDCLTDPGIVCSAVACRPEREPLFRGATAELCEAKQEIFAFQRNNGASNVRKRCGVFRARVGDCLTDPGIVCSAVACRPERDPLFRGATAELYEAKQEIFAFQRNNGASNVRKRCGAFRARVGDCLTDPGIVCSAVACRPEREPLFRGATAELYEAGEGVSAALARNAPQRSLGVRHSHHRKPPRPHLYNPTRST